MSVGVYACVNQGVGGTIDVSCGGSSWSSSSSSEKGGTFSTTYAVFEAIPDDGYAFVRFEVYIDLSTTSCSSLKYNRETEKNPYTVYEGFVDDGCSYCVVAYFEETTQYYTVTMNSYVDGVLYASRAYEFEEGDSISTASYVTTPPNSRFNYVYYGGQYSYFPTLTVYGNMTIRVYFRGRPSSWSWTSTIATGYAISLSASEWNNFTSRINAFRTYVGVATYGFTTVSSGTAITPEICNQARTAINEISGYQSSCSVPSALTAGSYPASFFNGLKNVLNAVQ